MAKKKLTLKSVETLKHEDASRINIPTAEYQSLMHEDDKTPIQVAYERRNRDLDPQLVWRGKDQQDWSDLVVQAPPLYIQEKVHPKVLIDDLRKQTEKKKKQQEEQMDLFSDFNGLPDEKAQTEFYQHDANWSNRMILGDGLQVMASLTEREGLRGKVQCIYLDPPYGIKFNSNFQWSTTSRDVKDGKKEHITREPEQVKAFRDTWRDGIHSYLTYLRDRLTVARDLLTESGSIFVQIGDENVHRVRDLMDEIFGEENFISTIMVQKTGGLVQSFLPGTTDYILFYGKNKSSTKFRSLFFEKKLGGDSLYRKIKVEEGITRSMTKAERLKPNQLPKRAKVYRHTSLESANPRFEFTSSGIIWRQRWKTNSEGLQRLDKANRTESTGKTLHYVRYHGDFPVMVLTNNWGDTQSGGFNDPMIYVVQTTTKTVQRCILMATDPGDIVLDPTCGSGTTAYVAEQWGRRWITIDTSRVALALARARLMGARYPYYLLADSNEGKLKEAEITHTTPFEVPVSNNIRHGFVYERVPHITLKSIANNTEIDVIYEKWQPKVEQALADLNAALKGHRILFKVSQGGREGKKIDFTASGTVKLPSGEDAQAYALLEWEVPREKPEDWPSNTELLLENFWKLRIARQKEIDESITTKADQEYLYDKPYEDKKKVRVAGPFTVESLSPHRVLTLDENDELLDGTEDGKQGYGEKQSFNQMVLENLRMAGVQQAHKEDKINFSSLTPWPGDLICAEGRFTEGEAESGHEKRAAVFIGPEFGTVSRPDLVEAAREAADAGFDVLITCAFNYDAHSSEFSKLGRLPVLKARMNADLHMGEDLKNTGKGNLFVIFGEPDIDILDTEDGKVQVRINGVDVFHPNSGEVRSDGADGIACWFLDTDYNEESFFVRHAYFLGANDPYKSLKKTLKAEINEEAWETLNSDISRPFEKPKSGRIAVKVINHLGDEVMKIFRVQ